MVIMDQEQLNSDILSTLPNDPLYIAHLKELKPRWSVTPNEFLCHDNLIYIPNSNDLQLRVLCYKHDHILSGHPRIRQWTSSAAITPGLDSVNLSRNIVNLVQLVCEPNPRGINLMVY